jgi:hypothetical protein
MRRVKSADPLQEYLATLAIELRGLPGPEVAEIVRELHGHILERLAGDWDNSRVCDVLRRLGDPRAIARGYVEAGAHTGTGSGLADKTRRTPVSCLTRGARTLARVLAASVGSALAYGFAACWLFTALAKPFQPARVGLWLMPDANGDLNLSLGSHGTADIGRDLLGWWVVPIGLALGAATALLTWRWNGRLLRRWILDRRVYS